MQNADDYLNLLDDVLDGPEESIIIVNLPERHSVYSSCTQQRVSARASQPAAQPRREIVL